jgi:hypothetical protein
MPNDTHPCPGTPRRAGAGTHPSGRRPGRPSHPIRLRAPRLVPLTDEHERAALAALAALLAPLMADHGHDHTDDRFSDDTGGDHE